MSDATKPIFTQRLSMHLNGGHKWSSLSYDVFRDGKPTGIRRFRKTNGSPRYLITQDVLTHGNEEFDLMATKGADVAEWLEKHSQDESPEQGGSP
jgi:hypothetical protein